MKGVPYKTLDNGDSLEYGWSDGPTQYPLGTLNGSNEAGPGTATNEIGSISVSLPPEAQTASLELYFSATVNSGSDTAFLTGIMLEGSEIETGTLLIRKVIVGDPVVSPDAFTVVVVGNEDDPYAFDPGGEVVLTLPVGTYSILEEAAEGFSASYEHCTDVAVTTGDDPAVCIITNTSTVPPPYRIVGMKWNDVNQDGIKNDDESGLQGWTVTATDVATMTVYTTTTAEDGRYTFAVHAGTWEVSEDLRDGWVQTYPREGLCTVTLPAVGSDDSFLFASDFSEDAICDFGNYQKMEEGEDEHDNDTDGGIVRGSKRTHAERSGQVLGATTSAAPSCSPLLFTYMRMGMENDVTEVIKLQTFLTEHGYPTPATGYFGPMTDRQVRLFQERYRDEVLKPWVDLGIAPDLTPTGYVFKTTRWKINNLSCPGSEAYPTLP